MALRRAFTIHTTALRQRPSKNRKYTLRRHGRAITRTAITPVPRQHPSIHLNIPLHRRIPAGGKKANQQWNNEWVFMCRARMTGWNVGSKMNQFKTIACWNLFCLSLFGKRIVLKNNPVARKPLTLEKQNGVYHSFVCMSPGALCA